MLSTPVFQQLESIRSRTGEARTTGISDQQIKHFLDIDPSLSKAIERAHANLESLLKELPDKKEWDEKDLIIKLQEGFLNFYPTDGVSPYVPLGAAGSWIVTLYGAVVVDVGGYGMLGLGHVPEDILNAMSQEYVMANIMTPSISQHRFFEKLKSKIGLRGKDKKCPYDRFVCMNSGSESMSVGARISDLHAKAMTDPDGPHAGKTIMFLALEGGFHGRTSRPAQASDSTAKKYENLATFRDRHNLKVIEPNNIKELEGAYTWAKKENVYFEALFMEPVLGEGNPGVAITPEFYKTARRLTKENQSYLIIDSIQAGLRTHGVLSIIDYPGFEDLEAPDMETFSKALNAGQYPLSVLALPNYVADIYIPGIYGNTMTTNPRGLEVGLAVLDAATDELAKNITDRGEQFKKGLLRLMKELPDIVTRVEGTGLLFSAELTKSYKVTGAGGVEEAIRLNGVNLIHGGENSLRFTPPFNVSEGIANLILEVVEQTLKAYEPKN